MLQVEAKHAIDLIQMMCCLADDARSEKLDDEEREPLVALYRQLSVAERLQLSGKMHHSYKGPRSNFFAIVYEEAGKAPVPQKAEEPREKGISRRIDELEQEVRDLKAIILETEMGEEL